MNDEPQGKGGWPSYLPEAQVCGLCAPSGDPKLAPWRLHRAAATADGIKKQGTCAAALLAGAVALAVFGAGAALASSPKERIVCNTQPGQAWMGKKRIKAVFGMDDYVRVDFKVSRTQCYECYAIHKNGDVAEAYYHPVTGELIQRNVIPHGAGVAAGAASAPGGGALLPASAPAAR